MSASDILARLKALPVGEPINWTKIREEISDNYDGADSAERATLLQIFKVVMDTVEKNLTGADLETFRSARRQDYNRLLVSECLIDGNVSSAALAIVTSREVKAGRMSPDDELHRLAIAGPAGIGVTEKPVARGWRRAFSFGRKEK
jgi:hypothetical protein